MALPRTVTKAQLAKSRRRRSRALHHLVTGFSSLIASVAFRFPSHGGDAGTLPEPLTQFELVPKD